MVCAFGISPAGTIAHPKQAPFPLGCLLLSDLARVKLGFTCSSNAGHTAQLFFWLLEQSGCLQKVCVREGSSSTLQHSDLENGGSGKPSADACTIQGKEIARQGGLFQQSRLYCQSLKTTLSRAACIVAVVGGSEISLLVGNAWQSALIFPESKSKNDDNGVPHRAAFPQTSQCCAREGGHYP